MKRNLSLIVLLLTTVLSYAQASYQQILDHIQLASPQEALYQLSGYQQLYPQFAPVYYQMGKLSKEALKAEHPIRNYTELSLCLYQIRLYYGNCIHYAEGQTIKPAFYEGVPWHNTKRPDYNDLRLYLEQEIQQVQDMEQKSTALYQSYCQMVERYNYCRQLFTNFSETYLREKNAHLLLTNADRDLLNELAVQADSIQSDISAFEKALANYPIENYAPVFRFQRILLYRLDGLANTDMLQDAVSLWDYASWARNFLTAQETTYRQFYTDIDHEYQYQVSVLNQLLQGERKPVQKNEVLLNRIDRLDYASFMVPWMHLMQLASQAVYDSQDSIYASTNTIQALEQAYQLYQLVQSAKQDYESYAIRVNEDEMRKYRTLLEDWQMDITTLTKTATQNYNTISAAYQHVSRTLMQATEPTITPFTKYYNDLTQATITAANLQFTIDDELIDILPVGENYMAVIRNGQTILFDTAGRPIHQNRYTCSSPIRAARKLNGSTIALLTDEQIVFINQYGAER